MAVIKAPVPVNGIPASLLFQHGEARTDNPWLIQWFSEHGYQVEKEKQRGKKGE